MQETRKLRTILFADIAGYTALMQNDEQQALHQLGHFKEILTTVVPSHQGKIIQYFGDGCLLTFESATQGVQCASALQQAFGEREIPVRMGMHLGEVLLRNNNAFGDGVNLASRIESMGVPGAVLVSKAVRNQLQNKAEFSLRSLGSFAFKNVSEPIEVFALANAGLIVPKRADLKGKGKQTQASKPKWAVWGGALLLATVFILVGAYFWKGDNTELAAENEDNVISSIAVFPFDVKGSPDIAYLGEGIVDLISTQLSEIPRLNSIDPNELLGKLKKGEVISRQPKEAAELASSLGASKFILGSIVQIGEELQFAATKYDANGRQIVRQSVQTHQKEGIANTINDLIKELVADELEAAGYELGSLGAATSNNLESLKLYLQGEQANRDMQYAKANELFSRAVEIDSTFALAWMRKTGMIGGFGFNDSAKQKWAQYKHTMPYKWQLYFEAIELARMGDPRAITAFKKLIQQYGNTPVFIRDLAEFYFHLNESFGGSPTEAKPYLLKTIELDPGNLEALFHLGNIAVMENDMEEIQRLKSMPNNRNNQGLLMMELILKDTVTDAEIEQVLAGNSNPLFFPILYFASEKKPFHNKLLSRAIRLRPSPEGERLANVSKFCTTGREKEGFAALKEVAKNGNLMGFSLGQIQRCLPATLIAVGDFSPFSDYYASLYQDTRDRDTPWETYAAIKYALALHKSEEVLALKKKLQSLASSPQTHNMVKYYDFSIRAFEARRAGDNEQVLAYIDSSSHYTFGFWPMQGAGYWDKTILAANIYADQGQYEKAISYFNHSYVIFGGAEVILGYRNYKLSQWYEAIGDTEHALIRCNILLESYQNCDEKYQPWVEEVRERRERLMALTG